MRAGESPFTTRGTSLPFHPIHPRARRPLAGAAIIALSYAVPILAYVGVMVDAHQRTLGGRDASPLRLETAELVYSALLALGLIALIALSPRAFKYGAALQQRDAIDLIESDGRPPVLYLRSFGDDAAPDYTGSALPVGANQTVEMRLAHALRSVGAVISIGRPGERLPELGSNRFYVSDAEWQRAVRYFLARSAAVVIVVGRSTGLTWEIQTALDEVPHGQLLFVFPYLLPGEKRTWKLEWWQWLRSMRKGSGDTLGKHLLSELRAERRARYEAFRENFGHAFPAPLPTELSSSIFVDYLADGSPRLIPTRQPLFVRRRRDRQGVTLDYARTLRPFIEKLQNRTIPPDRIERILTSRRGLRVVTVLCGLVAVAGFVSPLFLGFRAFALVLFFLASVPGMFAYWGAWTLLRETPGSAGAHVARFAPAAHSSVVNAHVTYALSALGLLFAIPGIVALGMAYWQRRRVQGTFLEPHVRWQIRTLWSALGWLVTAIVLAATVFLAPLALILTVVTYLWVCYRIARGWRALGRGQPVFPSRSLLE
jgi:uncharacterized membrane protein